MKAILVIDVDDINRFHAHVYKEDENGNGELVMSYLPFKPMPNEREEKDHYDYGWNDCVRVLNDDYNLCKLG